MSQQEPSGILEVLARAAGAGVSDAAQNFRGDQQQKKTDEFQNILMLYRWREQQRAAEEHRFQMLQFQQNMALNDANLRKLNLENAALAAPNAVMMPDDFIKNIPENAPPGTKVSYSGGPYDYSYTAPASPVNPLTEARDVRTAYDETGILPSGWKDPTAPGSTAEVRASEKYATDKRQDGAIAKMNELWQDNLSDSERVAAEIGSITSLKDANDALIHLMKTGGRTKVEGSKLGAISDWLWKDKQNPELIEQMKNLIAEYQGAEDRVTTTDDDTWGVKEYGEVWNTKTDAQKKFLVENYRK